MLFGQYLLGNTHQILEMLVIYEFWYILHQLLLAGTKWNKGIELMGREGQLVSVQLGVEIRFRLRLFVNPEPRAVTET